MATKDGNVNSFPAAFRKTTLKALRKTVDRSCAKPPKLNESDWLTLVPVKAMVIIANLRVRLGKT